MKKTATVKKPTVAATSTKPKNTAKAKAPIEKACEVALEKLKELNIDSGFQSEIEWCLGSYRHDKNPSGLYLMAKRALAIFTVEQANHTKTITDKLISDMEKAIGNN